MPLVRNLFVNPAAGNTIAFILRWGIGSAAAIGTVDAVSGATNSFTTPTSFSGTVGTTFTNYLTIASYGGDPGAYTTITSGGNTAVLTVNGQTTTVGMPPGLTLKFFDLGKGPPNGLYDAISGTPTTAGTYTFTVSMSFSGYPTVTTGITITIGSGGTAPSITGQPASLTNGIGSNAVFSVTAAGTAPLAYQWFYSVTGVSGWTSISGATGTSLTLNNLQLTNAGFYTVIVTNAYGQITSAFANLNVGQPPVINTQPIGLTNGIGSSAAFGVTAGGTAPFTYLWYYSVTGTNAWSAILTATNSTFTLNNVQSTNAGYYVVIVNSPYGTKTSAVVPLTIGQSPIITNQPVSGITNVAGSSATFSVTAGGLPAVNYQWRLLTTNLTGATGSSLTLTNLRASQAGNYTVIVANGVGSVTSSVARLMVTNPLPTAFAPSAVAKTGAQFQFTFTPVTGLTNTVLTNGSIFGGTWGVFTNVPPSASPTPMVISNNVGAGSLFFRVQVVP